MKLNIGEYTVSKLSNLEDLLLKRMIYCGYKIINFI